MRTFFTMHSLWGSVWCWSSFIVWLHNVGSRGCDAWGPSSDPPSTGGGAVNNDSFFMYSQSLSYDFSSRDDDDDDDDDNNDVSDRRYDNNEYYDVSIASSSHMYDEGEGMFVSSQAFTCHGGDLPLVNPNRQQQQQQQQQQHRTDPSMNSFTATATSTSSISDQFSISRFFNLIDPEIFLQSDDEDDDDDDQDDDQDDGHSSMLSNAALKRSQHRAYACAVGPGITDGGRQQRQSQSYAATNGGGEYYVDNNNGVAFTDKAVHLIRTGILKTISGLPNFTRHPSKVFLQLRGGATATAAPRGKKSITASKRSTGKNVVPPTPTTIQAATKTSGLSTLLQSQVMRNLIVTALVTLVFELIMGHVLEFLKIAMQTAPEGTSYVDVIRDITAEKGIGGLWDGFVPWGVVQALFKGAVFGIAHSFAKTFLVSLADKKIMPHKMAYTLAGGIGGGFQGYVLSPTLLLKTRVMTNPIFRENMSILRTTWLSFTIGAEIVATEGLMTLMKGANVFATKRVCDWASRYFFSDLFEAFFQSRKKKGEKLTLAEKSISSLLGGVASTCVTLPLDVLVAKTQDAKKAGIKVSPFKMFAEELAERGWSGQRRAYMQGFEARLAHVCLTTLVVKTFVPIVYTALFPPSQP